MIRNCEHCQGLESAEDQRIYDRAGVAGDLRHPSLTYNCATRVEMDKEELKVLNKVKDFFLRLLWGTGPGAPKVALRADTGTRSMESRVWREKIMLIYHVSHLEDGDLAKDMLEEQMINNWPGLVKVN